MTKSELIQRIAEINPHLYHRDVERIVNTIFDEITTALSRGDRVELRGFGAFSVKQRDARVGRNRNPFSGRSGTGTGSSTRTEHLHFPSNNFSGVSFISALIFPLSGLDSSFNIYLASFF